MSVEGAGDMPFCVKQPSCSGESSSGNCPGPVKGLLEFGSYCGKLKSRAQGCIPLSLLPPLVYKASEQEADPVANCSILSNQTQVTVQGVGNLCARIPICSGNFTGNCPTTLTNLDETYRCVFDKGSYGCFV